MTQRPALVNAAYYVLSFPLFHSATISITTLAKSRGSDGKVTSFAAAITLLISFFKIQIRKAAGIVSVVLFIILAGMWAVNDISLLLDGVYDFTRTGYAPFLVDYIPFTLLDLIYPLACSLVALSIVFFSSEKSNPKVTQSINYFPQITTEELQEYAQLLNAGVLSQEEFDAIKQRFLNF